MTVSPPRSGGIVLPGPIGWLLNMADIGIPEKYLPAVRLGVFWIALPFISLLWAYDRWFNGTIWEVIACICGTLLSIAVAVYWDRIITLFWPGYSHQPALHYLHEQDSELGPAIRNMGWSSAWAKWFAAQYLATNERMPVSESHIMQTAAYLVLEALTNGDLEARGRKPGQMEYEPIPRTHWRSSGLHMVADPFAQWKMVLFPRGGAEISPSGVVVAASNPAAKQRTDELTIYDSLIVNSHQFESLWPRKDKKTDAARKVLLKKAKKAGADPAEIAKLARK